MMSNKTRKWIRAGLELLIHGLAAAIASTIAAASIDAKNWALFSVNFWKLALATFTTNGGLRFFQWWANNPIPPDGDTSPPISNVVPQISLSPLGKVQPIQTG